MSCEDITDNSAGIDRRDLIKSIGAATTVGLAGCLGGDGAEGLGERVPEPIVCEYWSDYGGFTTIQEDMQAVIQGNVEQALDIDFSNEPKTINTQLSEVYNDERNTDLLNFWGVNGFYRLDPQELTRWFGADNAGANGRANPANWANCDYHEVALEQQNAEDEEERRELVYESQQIISEACVPIALTPTLDIGAYREDEVDLQGVADAGMARTNPNFLIQSELTSDRDRIVIGVDPIMFETKNFLTMVAGNPSVVWETLLHSPLLWYDSSYELQPYLAEDYEVSDDGQTITFELRDDAVFHNGDQVTAEDVKFTFEQLVRGAEAGVYPKPSLPPYESIETLDEQTVEFNFTEPYVLFTTAIAPRWGILHRETWLDGNADEDPGGFEFEPTIGSGPYQFVDQEDGSHMVMEPFEDHPIDVPSQEMYWEAYRDESTAFEALEANEIQLQPEVSPGTASRAGDSDEPVVADYSDGFMSFCLYPQCSTAPAKFEEFRKAIAACINRQEVSDIAYDGQATPATHANHFMPDHPWRPSDDMLYEMADPMGDPEMARQILEDAEWGWDDGGNLRYPEGADLSPEWPEGEEPSPDDFPCLDG